MTQGNAAVPDRYASGVLDTRTYIDLDLIDPANLPTTPEITAVTTAELHQGVALAKDAASRAARTEKLSAAVADFEPLPFDGEAAARYGTLVALAITTSIGFVAWAVGAAIAWETSVAWWSGTCPITRSTPLCGWVRAGTTSRTRSTVS
jgi:predicted nucleic acid-binding protein